MERFSPNNVDALYARLAEKSLTLVDFSATWCGPCKTLHPKLDELAANPMFNNVQFLEVDVDDCSEVAEALSIEAMPTVIIYKRTDKVDTIVGANFDKIQSALKAALAS